MSNVNGSSGPGHELIEGLGSSWSDILSLDTARSWADGSARVAVPTDHLLFSGRYARGGADLIVQDEHDRLVVHDYFRAGKRPALVSPNGGTLSDDTVAALAGPDPLQRYAQAGATASDATRAIGRVETVNGTASAVRNGVTVALAVGDTVYKGDVVQTDRGSALGITFLDGTAFNLSAGARMVLNEMVYQSGATGNSSLMTLVQGSISFVAGQVAKTGDMRVDTPVATMGIRGTAVEVRIDANNGETRFAVMREPDGRVGSYVLYNRTDGSVIGTVSQPDVYVTIGPNGSVTQTAKTPFEQQAEAAVVASVFALFSLGAQNPFQPPAPPVAPGVPSGGGGSSTSPNDTGAATQDGRPDPNGSGNGGLPGGLPGTGPAPGSGAPQGGPAGPPPGTGTDQGPNGPGVPPLASGTGASPSGPSGGSGTGGAIPVAADPNGPAIASATVPAAPDRIVAVSATSGTGLLSSGGAAPAAGTHIVGAQAGSQGQVSVDAAGPTTLVGRYGTLAIGQDGSYVYAPLRAAVLGQGEHGQDSFTYTAVDANGRTATATLSFDITGVNDAPVAASRYAVSLQGGGVAEATTRATGLLAGITDPDDAGSPDGGDTARLQIVAASALGDLDPPLSGGVLTLSGAYGTLTIYADGRYRYEADHAGALGRGAHGQDVFVYTVADPLGATVDATFTVELDGTAATLVARPDGASVQQGAVAAAAAAGGLLANDTDGAQDGSAVLSVARASGADGVATDIHAGTTLVGRYGTLTLSADGSYSYAADNAARLAAGQHDGDTFAYTVADRAGDRADSTLTVDVAGIDDAPVGQPDAGGTLVRGATLAAGDRLHGVLGNDLDPDAGDAARLAVTSVRASAAGPATGPAGGTPLTPVAAAYLSAGHDLVAGLGGASGFGESALPGNDDGSSAAIDVTSIFGAAGLNLFGRSFTSLYVNNNGNLTFTAPSSTFVPTPIQGTAGNPIIAALWYDVDTRGGAVGPTPGGRSTGSDLVYYDLDAANRVFTATWDDVGYYSGGTDRLNAYQLQLIDRGGGDFDIVFRYEATNYGGATGARVGYSGGDAAHSYELPQSGDAAQIVGLASATGNTGIVGLDVFQVRGGTVTSVAQPVGQQPTTLAGAYGTLTIAADGTYSYTADHAAGLAAGQHASDSFVYTLADPSGAASSATLSFDIVGLNTAPAAQDASATTAEDTALQGRVSASDADGDALAYAVGTGPAHGSLTLNGDGRYVYTPAANYGGPDSFTFTASDGQATSSAGTVSLAVTPVNDAPVAQNASATTAEDTALSGSLAASDADGDALAYAVATGPAHGTVTLQSGGYVYTPAANYNGPDNFTFTASDGQATSAAATVAITVTPVNDAPTAQNASATTAEDTALSGSLAASDADGDPLAYAIATGPAHGTVTLQSGAYVYTPAANYGGPDSFTFTASDGQATSAAATVAITVTPVNDAPTAQNASASTTPRMAVTVPVQATDADGDALAYTIASAPAHGTVALESGAYVYHPDGSYAGLDSFTFTATDGQATSNVATVSIAVGAAFDLNHTYEDDGSSGYATAYRPPSGDGRNSYVTGNVSIADLGAAIGRATITVSDMNGIGTDTLAISPDVLAAHHLGLTSQGGGAYTLDPTPATTDPEPTRDDYAAALNALTFSTTDQSARTVTVDIALDGGYAAATSTIAVGAFSGGQFGYALASVGDIDGDGIDDFAASSAGVGSVGVSLSGTQEASLDVTGTGDDRLGAALARIGDIDGNHRADFIVGAPERSVVDENEDRTTPGFAYVIFSPSSSGSATIDTSYENPDHVDHYAIQGAADGDQAGYAVAGAGYVNGDDTPDVLVGAPGAGEGAGAAYLVYGKSDGDTVSLASLTSGEGIAVTGAMAGDHAGFAVAGGGDVNRDGSADFLIGAPDADQGAGAAYLVYGSTDLSDVSLGTSTGYGLAITGAAAGDHAGYALANVGDVNGDGYDDFAVGAPGATFQDRTGAGAVYVIYGGERPDSSSFSLAGLDPTRGFVIHGAKAGDHLGSAVAAAGDLDGDGYADILVSAPDASVNGLAQNGAGYAVHGSASPTDLDAATFTVTNFAGDRNGSHLGDSVASTGDDGSGTLGIAAGAPASPTGDAVNAGYYITTGGGGLKADAILGTAGDDASLVGTTERDIIDGQQGNDRLVGKGGADYLIGGSGHDTFVFNVSDAGGRSVIADFHPASTLVNGPTDGQHDMMELTGFANTDGNGVPVVSAITAYNSHDTLITLDGDHSILLKGVIASSLTASDFHNFAA